ncbi:MAG: hypothetical protein EXS16_07850 [Gemmataceae bacterium]|nr:hypothetical protein [Gemmataceae bacterium]
MYVSTIGAAIALLCVWVFSNGDPRDQHLVPYFLYGGPALVTAFATGMLLLRTLLRQRIQPNHRFPQPPKLPAGTPPALFGDSTRGEFWPAISDRPPVSEWQEFQIGRNLFPLVCCGCLRTATTEHALTIPIDHGIDLEIPQCAECAKKPLATDKLGWLIFAAIVLLIGGMTLTFFLADSGLSCVINFGLLALFLVSVVIIAMIMKKPGPVDATVVDVSRGVVRIRFHNAEYGRLVAEHAKETSEPTTEPATHPTTAIEAALPQRQHGVREPETPK